MLALLAVRRPTEETHMNPGHHPQRKLDRDDQETVERRASTSNEFPTNVTRSTQDLTVGGSEKDTDSQQKPTLESGDESPG
jgi:hypothetical protein